MNLSILLSKYRENVLNLTLIKVRFRESLVNFGGFIEKYDWLGRTNQEVDWMDEEKIYQHTI